MLYNFSSVLCPVGEIRCIFPPFSHLSHWVVLSKGKRRRPSRGALLASLRASQRAPLAADEMTAEIRLEFGGAGEGSHAMQVVPLIANVHPARVYLYVTPALAICRIVRFPWQMGEENVRRIFREALKIWSDVTPLTFTEVRSGKADIRIDFTR